MPENLGRGSQAKVSLQVDQFVPVLIAILHGNSSSISSTAEHSTSA